MLTHAKKIDTRTAAELSHWPVDVLYTALSRGLLDRPAGHRPRKRHRWSIREVGALRACRAVWEATRNFSSAVMTMRLIVNTPDEELDAAFAAGKRYVVAIYDMVLPRLFSRETLDESIETARKASENMELDLQVFIVDVERAINLVIAGAAKLGQAPETAPESN